MDFPSARTIGGAGVGLGLIGLSVLGTVGPTAANPFPIYPYPGSRVVYDVTLKASTNRAPRHGKRAATTTVLCQRGHMLRTETKIDDGRRKIETRSVSYRMLLPTRVRTQVQPRNFRSDTRFEFDRALLDAYAKGAAARPAKVVVRAVNADAPNARPVVSTVTINPTQKETVTVPAGKFETFKTSTVWKTTAPTSSVRSVERRATIWASAKLGVVVRYEDRQEIVTRSNKISIHHVYVASEISRVQLPADACKNMPSK